MTTESTQNVCMLAKAGRVRHIAIIPAGLEGKDARDYVEANAGAVLCRYVPVMWYTPAPHDRPGERSTRDHGNHCNRCNKAYAVVRKLRQEAVDAGSH